MGDGDPTACRAGVAGCGRQQRAFGEAQLAQRIRGYLPEQGQLFAGNSPVVRLIDAPRSCRPGIRSTATAAPAASMA